MLNALLQVTLAVLVRSHTLTDEARPLIGIVAAVLAAILASYASWHLTDRVVAWRHRADHDEL